MSTLINLPAASSPTQRHAQTQIQPQQQPPAYTAPVFLLNFSWKKLHVLVTEESLPSSPSYTISIHTTVGPHVLLRSFPDGSTIGTGNLHLFSITPDIDIHGHPGRLRALKRFQTSYSYLSYAYSESRQPVLLQWRSASGFVAWDFACVDGDGNTVARFSASVFAVSKVARVEFTGPKAYDQKAREEILLVGMTLYYCMVSRTYNVFNIFGSVFLKTGPERSELRLADGEAGGDKYITDKEHYGPTLNLSRQA